jgi:hypothetical protein
MPTGILRQAGVQDRDGAIDVVAFACDSFPTVIHLFADGGYAGEKLETALAKIDGPSPRDRQTFRSGLGSSSSSDDGPSSAPSLGSIACRRLAKDREASIASSEAWLFIASIRQLSRRIAKASNQSFQF